MRLNMHCKHFGFSLYSITMLKSERFAEQDEKHAALDDVH